MQIHQYDIGDVINYLPDLRPFDKSCFVTKECRLFICTLGFEDRTSRIVKELSQSGLLRKATLLLICYPTNEEENVVHLPEFESAALAMRGLRKINYSRADFLSNMAAVLAELDPDSPIIFDISTCSSYVFFPVMRSIVGKKLDLSIVYAEASVYYPTQSEWSEVAARADKEGSLYVKSFEEADFQSLGVEDVYPYSIFSEMNPGNRTSALIAVPNFSVLRMSSIIIRDRELNKTVFRNVVWILGDPPNEENKWRIDAIKRTNDMQNVREENLVFASTLHYKDMIGSLEDIWLQRRYKLNLSIGSLGSKMQHLGTFFFLFLHQDVGIWLAEPKKFQAQRFSRGVNNLWQVELGCMIELCQNLSSYMTFRWNF
jgi:hypothetical protein